METWQCIQWIKLSIFAAAQRGKTGQIRALIESGRARATDRDDDNITPLHWAAIKGHAEACGYLIEQGAEVNAAGGTGLATPLQWAARNGLVGIIDLLIQHGANPRLLDAQGYSCLHSVAHSCKYWALLYVVCRPEVEIDEPDKSGNTPLHWAVYQRDEFSTHILLKLGANPNAVNRDGHTPLHFAAFTGSRKCITELLEAGADIRMKNRNLHTAEQLAYKYHNIRTWNEVVGELGIKSDGTKVRRPLSEVCSHLGPCWADIYPKRIYFPLAQCEYYRLLIAHFLALCRLLDR
jgi:palmitoyltransferase